MQGRHRHRHSQTPRRRRRDRYRHRRVSRHVRTARRQAARRALLRRRSPRRTACTPATTCSPATWTWIRCRATPSRRGRRATATSVPSPISTRCASLRGCRRRRSCCATSIASTSTSSCRSRRAACCGISSSAPRELGFAVMAASELELYVFKDSYETVAEEGLHQRRRRSAA